jgi:hypothetical protein
MSLSASFAHLLPVFQTGVALGLLFSPGLFALLFTARFLRAKALQMP